MRLLVFISPSVLMGGRWVDDSSFVTLKTTGKYFRENKIIAKRYLEEPLFVIALCPVLVIKC